MLGIGVRPLLLIPCDCSQAAFTIPCLGCWKGFEDINLASSCKAKAFCFQVVTCGPSVMHKPLEMGLQRMLLSLLWERVIQGLR